MTSEVCGPADGDIQSSQQVENDIDWLEAAAEAVPNRPPSPSISTSLYLPITGGETESFTTPLPSFLKPPPANLGKQDLEYLDRKGALQIPEPELRDALIECYVHYIHPCYPILDLGELEEAISGNSTRTISLSVFQAIMFAGSAWADRRLLRKLGYLSTWAARNAFYTKVRVSAGFLYNLAPMTNTSKLLYDTDYEQDRVCQLQTLVLLSLWWKAPNEQKDGWHWLGLAISLARTMGLHHDAAIKGVDAKTRALRRRLWWSCMIRDTFTSMSCNRVPRVSDADFTTAPLTLHDFEWYEQRDDSRRGIGQQSLDVQKQLGSICIQTAAICRIITGVLLAAYNETSTGKIDILYVNSNPDHGKSCIGPTHLRDIEEAFRAWQINQSPNTSHSSPIPLPLSRHEQAPLLHRALLAILYYAGLILLHRQRDPNTPHNDTPRDLVRDAARQVNKIIMDMFVVDLMKDMSPTVITLLFPVSMSHISDMRSQDLSLRREGAQRLEECKQALRELADSHIAAEWAVNFLKHAESKIKAQFHVEKALYTATNVQRPSTPEVTSYRNDSTYIRRQDHSNVRNSTQNPSATSPSGEDASRAHMQPAQGSFVSDFGDSLATDNNFDWIDLPDLPDTWFGFPEAQWVSPSMEQLDWA